MADGKNAPPLMGMDTGYGRKNVGSYKVAPYGSGHGPVQGATQQEEEKSDDGGGGGSAPPSLFSGSGGPFPGNAGINLKSRQEIEQGYQTAIEKGEQFLEALGHESFRDLVSTALAAKFTLPDNYEQLLSGETAQPATTGNAQFNPGGIQNTAQQALQTGLNQIPTGGQNSGNNS